MTTRAFLRGIPSIDERRSSGNELGSGRNTSSIRTSGCDRRSISSRASTSSAPRVVVDLGCGAGNVTALSRAAVARCAHRRRRQFAKRCWRRLAPRLPASRAASGSTPISRAITPDEPIDVVYSNAALHWQDDHRAIVSADLRLGCARRRARRADARSICGAVSRRGRGGRRERRNGATGLSRVAAASAGDAARPIIFGCLPRRPMPSTRGRRNTCTFCRHRGDGVHPVVAWIKGTTLTPFLAALPADASTSVHRRRFATRCRALSAAAGWTRSVPVPPRFHRRVARSGVN